MRILILGGSSEAAGLARHLAARRHYEATLSLAGRTAEPAEQAVPTRVGGFGGVPGLIAYLQENQIQAVVDATHPFAVQMSRHAAEACAETGIPLIGYSRAPWTPVPGDHWTEVADNDAAIAAIGAAPKRVLMTIGRLGIDACRAAPQHRYIIRSIDPPGDLAGLPNHRVILARGPFSEIDELALLDSERIQVVVSKNSGGKATSAKLAAARMRRIPVIMVKRPDGPPAVTVVHELRKVIVFLANHRPDSAAP